MHKTRRDVNYGNRIDIQHRVETDMDDRDNQDDNRKIREVAKAARHVAVEHNTPQEEKKRK